MKGWIYFALFIAACALVIFFVGGQGALAATWKYVYWIGLIVICAAIVSWIFREILRRVMPEFIAKPMRQAPLTAAFGLLIILIYVAVSLGAPLFAPYGEAEIFKDINVLPGGNPELGGNPDHLLGTDQIGRDILSRLIYGARNTVGIAFLTTILSRRWEAGSIRCSHAASMR